jgi:hypothetical protein
MPAEAATSGSTFITSHSLRPDDTEYIGKAEIFLRNICYRPSIESSEVMSGKVSWIVTLTDSELLISDNRTRWRTRVNLVVLEFWKEQSMY